MKAVYHSPRIEPLGLDALYASAARFKHLMQYVVDAVLVLGDDQRVEQANPSASRLLGLSPEKLIGRHVRDLIPSDRRVRDLSLEAVDKNLSVLAEYHLINHAGHELDTEVSVSPTPEGGAIAIIRDITRRKRSEAALREAERRYRELTEGMPYAVAIFQDGRVVYVNRTSAAIFGFDDPLQIIGRDAMGPVPPHERERLARWAAARLTGCPDTPDHIKLELQHKDGRLLQVEAFACAIEHLGRPALHVVAQDVTEREGALRASEHRYRSLVEHLPVAVGIIQDGRLVFANRTAATMLGFAGTDELLRADMLSLVMPEEVERIADYQRRWVGGDPDRPHHYTTRLRRCDGRPLPIEVLTQIILFDGRPAIQAIGIDRRDSDDRSGTP